jgi:hypothetical protein
MNDSKNAPCEAADWLRWLGTASAKGRNSAESGRHFLLARPLHCQAIRDAFKENKPTEKGVATMFKKFFIALGIVTLTSTSAFAAKVSHKAPASITAKKVAQADSAKPADAKGKKGKKAGKKAAEEKAPAPAPAPAK